MSEKDQPIPEVPKSGRGKPTSEQSSSKGITKLSDADRALIAGSSTSDPAPPITVTHNPPGPSGPPITVTHNPPPGPSGPPITVTAPPGPQGPPITVTHTPPPPPTSPPAKNPNCGNPQQQVDISFISTQEGGQRLKGYVPASGNSGVTIATGIDLHNRTQATMSALGWPQSLINKLLPYTTQTGTAAAKHLIAAPLNITVAEANIMDSTVMQGTINELAASYNAATGFADFFQLPEGAQSAIADVAFQYTYNGTTMAQAAPNFWNQVTHGDWTAAYNNLMNYGDAYTTRRHADAAKLKQAMDHNSMPTPSNPC